jgi:hypothetical protein
MNINATFAIVSAQRSDLDASVNQARHAELLAQLAEYPHKTVVGCYQDGQELAALIMGPGAADIAAELAEAYSQECYLLVGSGHAWSCDLDDESHLGAWLEVPRAIAERCDNWTLDPDDGRCYTTRSGLDKLK